MATKPLFRLCLCFFIDNQGALLCSVTISCKTAKPITCAGPDLKTFFILYYGLPGLLFMQYVFYDTREYRDEDDYNYHNGEIVFYRGDIAEIEARKRY